MHIESHKHTLHPLLSKSTVGSKVIRKGSSLDVVKHNALSGFDNTVKLHGIDGHLILLE